jgi:hypothetical protein
MESRASASQQTLRRAQAMGDLRNAVSATAVGRGALFDNPENMLGPIRQSHVANMDATTLVLHTEGARAERTYFFKGESKKARTKNQQLQAVGETKAPTKYLRIKFWCTTLASGKLCTPVFSLVVDGLQTMERIKVFLLLYLVELALPLSFSFTACRTRQRWRSTGAWTSIPDSCRTQEDEGQEEEEDEKSKRGRGRGRPTLKQG